MDDRTTQRPALSLREFSATIHKGKVTAQIGRQIIRWGKTDILTPTDRFAPKDYLSSVVDSDFLAVPAARVTIANATDSLDAIWQPWFTPSRTPLLDQRWTALPPELNGVTIVDAGARYPGRSQFGLALESRSPALRIFAFVFRRLQQPAAASTPPSIPQP